MSHHQHQDGLGNTISSILGALGSGGISLFLFKAVLFPAVAAIVGGVVGFYVNKGMKYIHNRLFENNEND